jgi:hypothetical protein
VNPALCAKPTPRPLGVGFLRSFDIAFLANACDDDDARECPLGECIDNVFYMQPDGGPSQDVAARPDVPIVVKDAGTDAFDAGSAWTAARATRTASCARMWSRVHQSAEALAALSREAWAVPALCPRCPDDGVYIRDALCDA